MAELCIFNVGSGVYEQMTDAIRLGVNIDHVATLRNARGGLHPDPFTIAQAAVAAGADGITIHLREDRRHIRDDDARRICAGIAAPVNLEMAATAEMTDIACALRPHGVCIVPERRTEITTEGGLDVIASQGQLRPIIAQLNAAGIVVSLFVDPQQGQLEAAVAVGAAVVELHTGAYSNQRPGELGRLAAAAAMTAQLGLECHAGHGLTYANVRPIAALPEIRELNIGHYLIGEALLVGLPASIRQMKDLMLSARPRDARL
jgi:pyridoxine 5-phosphate synthase